MASTLTAAGPLVLILLGCCAVAKRLRGAPIWTRAADIPVAIEIVRMVPALAKRSPKVRTASRTTKPRTKRPRPVLT